MSTSVTSVVSHFPSAQNGFTTTLASTIASGAATVPLNSVAGFTNGQIAVLVVDPTDVTKKQTFTGTVDTAGVQLTSVVWTAGTNQTHTGGSTVVDYATATHVSMITKGLLVEHAQAGTHAAATITGRTEDTSPAAGDFLLTYDTSATALKKVQPTNLMQIAGLVVPQSLMTGTGTSWAWQTWSSPVASGLTAGNGTTNYALYNQAGKTVRCRLGFTFGSTSAMTGALRFTLPVTSVSTYVADTSPLLNSSIILDSGTARINGTIVWHSTTQADLQANEVDGVYGFFNTLSSTVPMTWTTSDGFFVDFSYEAA